MLLHIFSLNVFHCLGVVDYSDCFQLISVLPVQEMLAGPSRFTSKQILSGNLPLLAVHDPTRRAQVRALAALTLINTLTLSTGLPDVYRDSPQLCCASSAVKLFAILV